MVDVGILGVELLNSISALLILVLVALGMAIIMGLMGIINLAHGEFFTCGAYSVYLLTEVGVNYWIALLLATGIVAFIGFLIERGIIRFVYGRLLESILVTWGVGLIIREGIRVILGAGFKYVALPLPGNWSIGAFSYPIQYTVTMAVSLIMILFTYVVIYRTDFGLKVRAVMQNREIASTLGINPSRIYSVTFAFGAALAGLAGAIMSPLINIFPEVGLNYLASSFLIVIMGGLGGLTGMVIAGIIVGELQSWVSFLLSGVWAQVLVFILAILVIRLRPEGILPTKGT